MSNSLPNEQLTAYLDGELTDTEARAVEQQLERDASLRAELDSLEHVSTFLRTHGPVQAPEGFEQRVLALVEHEPLPANDTRWWRRPLGVPVEGWAVAAAAVLVVGISLGTGTLTGSGAVDKKAFAPEVAEAPAGDPEVAAGMAAPQEEAAPAAPAPDPAPVAKATPAGTDSSSFQGDVGHLLPKPVDSTVADEKEAAPEVQSTKQRKASKIYATYRYTLTTDDPDVLAALMRLAGKHQGALRQASGEVVNDLAPRNGSFVVDLPPEALAEFGDALRSLGQVQEAPADYFGGPRAKVQVDLRYLAAELKGQADEKSYRPSSTPAQ